MLIPHYKKHTTIALSLCLLLSYSSVYALDDATASKTKTATCIACHNVDGNSTVAIYPKIAGQNQRYFIEQMLAYKKGKASGRNNPIMQSMVASLSSDDIANLATYYSQQTMSQEGADKQYLKLGQRLYHGGDLTKGIPACMACHGPQGEGNFITGFPRLGGQHADYTVAQLLAYRSGERSNGVNNIMGAIARKMSDNDMKAVASYIAGLH